MNDDEIEASKNRIASISFNTKPVLPKPPIAPPVLPDAWKNNPESRRWKPMIEKGKALSENLVGANKIKLVNLVNQLCAALAKNDSEKVEEHGNSLTDLLFDLGNE
jgi:hypothetical protein